MMKKKLMKNQRKKLTEEVELARAELEAYKRDAESTINQLDEKLSTRFAAAVQRFKNEINAGYSHKENGYRKQQKRIRDYDDSIIKIGEAIEHSSEQLYELKAKTDEAKSLYEAYDVKYRGIESERDELLEKISALQGDELFTEDGLFN